MHTSVDVVYLCIADNIRQMNKLISCEMVATNIIARHYNYALHIIKVITLLTKIVCD